MGYSTLIPPPRYYLLVFCTVQKSHHLYVFTAQPVINKYMTWFSSFKHFAHSAGEIFLLFGVGTMVHRDVPVRDKLVHESELQLHLHVHVPKLLFSNIWIPKSPAVFLLVISIQFHGTAETAGLVSRCDLLAVCALSLLPVAFLPNTSTAKTVHPPPARALVHGTDRCHNRACRFFAWLRARRR